MSGLKRLFRQKQSAWHQWLWSDPDDPSPGRRLRWLQAAGRMAVVCWHGFWRHDLLLRASALSFAVILAVVPVLALSTAVLKGLGAGDQMRTAAHQFIDSLAADSLQGEGLARETPEQPPPAMERRILDETFYHHLRRAVDTIFDYVERTDFATLGVVGVIGLFVTVVTMLATIEESLNAIWGAKAGRPLGRKVMDYLAVMLLLPLAVNIAMAAMAAFQSDTASRLIEQMFPMRFAGPLLINLLLLGLLTATLTICYRFLPNRRVDFRPALIGAFCGALAWLLLQALYINLQLGVARYNAIYGSFATLPLFLLWVYSSWLVFLTGAELSHAAQNWRRFHPRLKQLPPGRRLALVFDLLAAVYDDFQNRRPPSDLTVLARRLGLAQSEAGQVAAELLAAGYLRQVECDGCDRLIPASAADRIKAAELVDAFWGGSLPSSPGSRLVAEILAGARSALADRTLQDLEAAVPQPEESGKT